MIENAIRGLFWAIAKLFLSIGDWIYEILDIIINIDLSGSNVILYTWFFMMIFLTFACFFRIGFVLLQKTADDEESIDTSKLIKKIGGVFLVVTLSTTFFSFTLAAPGYIVRTYNNVITYDERMTSSTAVISATAKTPVTSSLGDMSSTDEVISIETIDEKLNEKESGEYVYFLGYAELLLCVVGAIIVAILQITLVVDTAIRLFLNIFRFVIGFIPISSLVEDNSTCGDWVKDMISDALMMMFVPISLNMVYGLMSTSAFTLLNGIVRIIIFAVALMAISKTGDMIAKYMGASNLSKGNGIGGMVTGLGSMMAIRGAGSVIKGAGKYIPKAAGGAAGGIGFLAKSGAEKVSQVSNTMKDNAIREAVLRSGVGLGDALGGLGSNNSPKGNKNEYFANDNSQESFQSGSSNQNIDESVLDQSPTSQVNETEYKSSMNGADAPGTAPDVEKSMKPDSSVNINKDLKSKEKGFTEGASAAEGVKKPYSPASIGGVAFVENPTSGHLYKSSSSVYKENVRNVYRKQQGENRKSSDSASQYSFNLDRKGSDV